MNAEREGYFKEGSLYFYLKWNNKLNQVTTLYQNCRSVLSEISSKFFASSRVKFRVTLMILVELLKFLKTLQSFLIIDKTLSNPNYCSMGEIYKAFQIIYFERNHSK